MRRSLPTILVVVLGALLLVDFVVVNPTLGAVAGALLELTVLLAAAAALAGVLALAAKHWATLTGAMPGAAGQGGPDRPAAAVVFIGLGSMLVAGFYPGSQGAA